MKRKILPGSVAVFLVFLVSNALLAYARLDPTSKGWVFVLGIVLPLGFGFLFDTHSASRDLFRVETFKVLERGWIWLFLVFLAIFFRLFKLSSLYLWPTGDEGLHGFLAIPLVSKWDWRFFYTVGEHPPLLIWMLTPCFKWFDSPFFSFWIWPAFFSIAALGIGFWGSKRFFSVSFSSLFTGLLAFSFWPLYTGRFCHQGLFVPFWELTCFLFLVFFLQVRNTTSKMVWIFILGLWTGLGTLTFTAWIAVLLLMILTVVGIWFYRYRAKTQYLVVFFAGLGVGLAPFLTAVIREGYGRHFLDTSSAGHFFSASHAFLIHLSYLTCLFWGPLQEGTSYGPVWGGVLNPILTSFFFIGVIELFRRRSQEFVRWIGVAFLICLLPGLLSSDYVEFNRVIQVMPFLLLVTVLGMQRLLVEKRSRLKAFLLLLFFVSIVLDLFHFLKPALAQPITKLEFKKGIPDENFKAYCILESVHSKQGPGLVFSDFLIWSHGHTLDVTTYHFNAALNPKLSPVEARWAAVIVNEHYQSFLSKRFKGSQWRLVSPVPNEEGSMVVGIIPIDQQNRPVFDRWLHAHAEFHRLSLQAENMFNHRDRYRDALEHLSDSYPLMRGDRFLESCFGEWMAQYHWGDHYGMNARIIEKAIAHGYSSAHLYYKLGEFLYLDDRYAEARAAFESALRRVPNHTQAAEAIRTLDEESRRK